MSADKIETISDIIIIVLRAVSGTWEEKSGAVYEAEEALKELLRRLHPEKNDHKSQQEII